jgi:hypothetical protein
MGVPAEIDDARNFSRPLFFIVCCGLGEALELAYRVTPPARE